MWWVGFFGRSCSSSSMLASEQHLGDVNMVWYGFSLWSLLRHDLTEHIFWAAGWASGQPYVSLQLMLFEGGSFPSSYWEGPFLFIRANVTCTKFAECFKILTRLCKVCHWSYGLWCCSVMSQGDGRTCPVKPTSWHSAIILSPRSEDCVAVNNQPDAAPASISWTWQYWGADPAGHSVACCTEIQVSPRNGRKAQLHPHELLLLQNWVFMFLSCQDHIRSIFIRQIQSSAAPSSGAPTSLSPDALSHSVQISCLHRICARKKLLTHKSVSSSPQQEI